MQRFSRQPNSWLIVVNFKVTCFFMLCRTSEEIKDISNHILGGEKSKNFQDIFKSVSTFRLNNCFTLHNWFLYIHIMHTYFSTVLCWLRGQKKKKKKMLIRTMKKMVIFESEKSECCWKFVRSTDCQAILCLVSFYNSKYSVLELFPLGSALIFSYTSYRLTRIPYYNLNMSLFWTFLQITRFFFKFQNWWTIASVLFSY